MYVNLNVLFEYSVIYPSFHAVGRDLLYLHGGRTDKDLALDDSYLMDTKTFTWTQVCLSVN